MCGFDLCLIGIIYLGESLSKYSTVASLESCLVSC